MTSFPLERLSDLCEINIGRTPSRSVREYWGHGSPWVSIADMNQGRALSQTKEQITDAAVRDANMRLVPAGAVLLSFKLSIGKVGIATKPIYTNEAIAALPIVRPDRLCTEFLYWALQSMDLTAGQDRAAMGLTLNKAKLSELRVPLPPLPEQRRIAAILDQADALRAKRREALAQLDSLTQSIFIEMFGDPVENLMGWHKRQLGSICEVGSSKRVFVEELVDEGIPFYRGTEVGQLGEDLEVTPSLFIAVEHYERLKSEAGVPRLGDLLLPSICPDGRIFLVESDTPFYFKDGRVLWIKASQGSMNSLFLRHQLKHVFAKNYAQIASGTTFAELKIFALKGAEICTPPMDLQLKFARIAYCLKLQQSRLRSSLDELNALFVSLQRRAFSGQLS